MSVAKVIELSAESRESFEHAVKNGIAKANDSLDNVQSVWIKDQQALINDGSIEKFRVHLKVTFALNG